MKYILGVDIGGTKTAVLLADEKAHFYERTAFATKEAGGYEGVLASVITIAQGFMEKYQLEASDFRGVGISCGGPLDSKKGTIMSPPNLPDWVDVPVVSLIEKALGIKTYLQNDANACAVAEWKFGAGKGARNMIFLTFGTGLGGGLILNNRLYHGALDLAGETGHIRLAEDGPMGYGKAGSFEGFCSGGGIANLAEAMTGEKGITARDVGLRARAGDPKALEIMQVVGEYLGRGLSILIDLLNPEKIIIGSIYARNENLLKPAALRVIQKEALPAAAAACEILPAGLGEQIGDYAAIAVAMNDF